MCDLNGRKIKEFSSLTEAADYIGVSRGAIRNCVNGIIKLARDSLGRNKIKDDYAIFL